MPGGTIKNNIQPMPFHDESNLLINFPKAWIAEDLLIQWKFIDATCRKPSVKEQELPVKEEDQINPEWTELKQTEEEKDDDDNKPPSEVTWIMRSGRLLRQSVWMTNC